MCKYLKNSIQYIVVFYLLVCFILHFCLLMLIDDIVVYFNGVVVYRICCRNILFCTGAYLSIVKTKKNDNEVINFVLVSFNFSRHFNCVFLNFKLRIRKYTFALGVVFFMFFLVVLSVRICFLLNIF